VGEGKVAVITTAQVVGSSMIQVQFAVLLVLYLRLVRGLSPVAFLGLRSRSFRECAAVGSRRFVGYRGANVLRPWLAGGMAC